MFDSNLLLVLLLLIFGGHTRLYIRTYTLPIYYFVKWQTTAELCRLFMKKTSKK